MRGITRRAEGLSKWVRPESGVSSRLIGKQTMVTSCTSGESELTTRLKRKEWVFMVMEKEQKSYRGFMGPVHNLKRKGNRSGLFALYLCAL